MTLFFMHILLLSPPWIALPPPGYGGIENVVFNLATGLSKRGHQITTLATGDSKVPGDLMYYYEKAIGTGFLLRRTYPLFMLNHINSCLKRLPKNIDIIHNHCEYIAMHLLDNQQIPFIHTLHGPYYKKFDYETKIFDYLSYSVRDTLRLFNNHPFITISDRQRSGMPDLNYIATVYNGISLNQYTFTLQPQGDYIYWIGRFSPQKGLKTAIKVAASLNKQIKISAVAHGGYKKVFSEQILPLVDNENVVYKGEEKDIQHKGFMFSNARLSLFPFKGEEPFGLVMVESMATGTPVVAYSRGSAPEVIKDGITGFLVNPIGEKRGEWIIKKAGRKGLIEAVERIYSLTDSKYIEMRKACRNRVEQLFTTDIMVENYLNTYEKVINSSA